YQNPIENLRKSGQTVYSADKNAREQVVAQEYEQSIRQNQQEQSTYTQYGREFTVFSDTSDFEDRRKLKEIETLQAQINQVVKEIKSKGEAVSAEVENVEKQALQSLPERPGKYHVNYLEFVLLFLQGIRTKVGEAKTWLQAMQSKKKKRGSAFVRRSKKLGTQYSMSQELQSARNVA
ncbi:MAG: DUF5660 family protein, partial [Candidatus Paceibacterota bacterium]